MSNSSDIYLLDTNVCIAYLKQKNLNVISRINALSKHQIRICAVVKAELFYGSMKSNNPINSRKLQTSFLDQFISLPFDDRCAELYGNICADLVKLGTPIGSNDLQIASIALVHDLILVTHNVREFSRVDGLKVEDWEGSNG